MRFATVTLSGIALAVLLAGPHINAAKESPAAPTVDNAQATAPVLVTRVYDVRSLIASVPDFPLETSPHGPGFLLAPGQAPQTNSGPGNALLCSQPTTQPAWGKSGAQPAEEEINDSITKLIEESVAEDTWKDNGGTFGRLRFIRGNLVVTQTAENQKLVESLLRQLSQVELVRVTADWVMLPLADLPKLIKPQAGGQTVLQLADPAILKDLPKSSLHIHAEVVGFSAQTVHLVSGRERTLVTNATPVVSNQAVAYAPTVSNVGGGLALQINPRIDPDRQNAMVTLFSTFTEPDRATAGMEIQGNPTTGPADGGAFISGHPTVRLERVSEVVQELQSSLRLPLGVPVIVGGMTLEPTTQNLDARQLVLILTVNAAK